jgi:hypothetical protein
MEIKYVLQKLTSKTASEEAIKQYAEYRIKEEFSKFYDFINNKIVEHSNIEEPKLNLPNFLLDEIDDKILEIINENV